MNNTNNYRIAKSLCTPSKLPASDYVINPYLGCTHQCMYCYASFMGRFSGHTEPWGTYIEPKKFLSMKLPRNLKNKTILVGSVTDAYNPAEKSYWLMPEILQVLSECEAHVEILTKSSLILRDLSLLKNIPDLSVGVSLSCLKQDITDELEPHAATPNERLDMLRILHENGIRTYLFIAPYMPGISDISSLAAAAGKYVDYICVENLNLRGSYKHSVMDYIKEKHNHIYKLYDDIYNRNGGGEYWKRLEEEIKLLQAETSIPIISYMYHDKIKKR